MGGYEGRTLGGMVFNSFPVVLRRRLRGLGCTVAAGGAMEMNVRSMRALQHSYSALIQLREEPHRSLAVHPSNSLSSLASWPAHSQPLPIRVRHQARGGGSHPQGRFPSVRLLVQLADLMFHCDTTKQEHANHTRRVVQAI